MKHIFTFIFLTFFFNITSYSQIKFTQEWENFRLDVIDFDVTKYYKDLKVLGTDEKLGPIKIGKPQYVVRLNEQYVMFNWGFLGKTNDSVGKVPVYEMNYTFDSIIHKEYYDSLTHILDLKTMKVTSYNFQPSPFSGWNYAKTDGMSRDSNMRPISHAPEHLFCKLTDSRILCYSNNYAAKDAYRHDEKGYNQFAHFAIFDIDSLKWLIDKDFLSEARTNNNYYYLNVRPISMDRLNDSIILIHQLLNPSIGTNDPNQSVKFRIDFYKYNSKIDTDRYFTIDGYAVRNELYHSDGPYYTDYYYQKDKDSLGILGLTDFLNNDCSNVTDYEENKVFLTLIRSCFLANQNENDSYKIKYFTMEGFVDPKGYLDWETNQRSHAIKFKELKIQDDTLKILMRSTTSNGKRTIYGFSKMGFWYDSSRKGNNFLPKKKTFYAITPENKFVQFAFPDSTFILPDRDTPFSRNYFIYLSDDIFYLYLTKKDTVAPHELALFYINPKVITGIEVSDSIKNGELITNFDNRNKKLNIKFKIENSGTIKINILDINGREFLIKNISNISYDWQEIYLDLNGISNGVYIINFNTGTKNFSRKILVN